MKKSEIYSVVSEEVAKVLEEAKVGKLVADKVQGIFDEYLAPKKAGMRINLDEVVKRDTEGKITHILDASGVAFLPATIDNFYEAKNGGIEVSEGLRLKRLSRLGEKLRKEAEKVVKTSEKAIMADILDGKITPEAGKAKLEEIKANNVPDYAQLLKVEGAIPAPTEGDTAFVGIN